MVDNNGLEPLQGDQNEDLRPVATDAHRELIAYAHAQMEHFQQIDECHIQGVITFKGEYLVATFHQSSIEDLSNDTWTLAVEPIEFVGIINPSEEAMKGEQILSVSPMDDDFYED